MSFLSTLGNIAKGVGGFLKSKSIGSSLAKTALLGFALNKVQKSINKESAAQKDQGARVQIAPDTETSIPVVYGQAYVSGKITDAVLADGNKSLWVCFTLCEKTGNTINGSPSSISIDEVYWDGLKLEFKSDGITVDKVYDEDGNSVDWGDAIKVYPFSGNSTSPVSITGQASGNTSNAYNIFPNWNSTKTMNDLVFVIVKISYNAEKKITTLGNVQFKVTNTMTDPGDCLYDYMTNTRYGAGINEQEINAS